MNEKNQALQSALDLINKKFGHGAVMFGNITKAQTSDVIPTGSLSIDIASGIGGLPQGRIVEIYGPEASGKTTLTLHVIAEAQKQGKMCAFIDAEHALDPIYAKKLGVHVDKLIISQPDNGEQGLEIADELTRSGVVDVVIIDSVAALTPKAEIEGEMGDSHMGLHARLMSQGLRKLTANVKANNVLLVFINQLRSKIGVVYGNPETTTGGNALKYYASMRLEVRRGEQIKDGDEIVGHGLKTKFAKNKMATPFKTVEPVIMYGKGFDRLADILNQAVRLGKVKKAGAWYSYQGEKIGQGKKAAQDWLSQHPDICDKLYKLALEQAQADDYEPTQEEREEVNEKDLEG